jgi:hypothetical protein
MKKRDSLFIVAAVINLHLYNELLYVLCSLQTTIRKFFLTDQKLSQTRNIRICLTLLSKKIHNEMFEYN